MTSGKWRRTLILLCLVMLVYFVASTASFVVGAQQPNSVLMSCIDCSGPQGSVETQKLKFGTISVDDSDGIKSFLLDQGRQSVLCDQEVKLQETQPVAAKLCTHQLQRASDTAVPRLVVDEVPRPGACPHEDLMAEARLTTTHGPDLANAKAPKPEMVEVARLKATLHDDVTAEARRATSHDQASADTNVQLFLHEDMPLYERLQAISMLTQNQRSQKRHEVDFSGPLKKLISTSSFEALQASSMRSFSRHFKNSDSEACLPVQKQSGQPTQEIEQPSHGVNWLHLAAAGALIFTVFQGGISQLTRASLAKKTIKIMFPVAALLAGKAAADVISLGTTQQEPNTASCPTGARDNVPFFFLSNSTMAPCASQFNEIQIEFDHPVRIRTILYLGAQGINPNVQITFGFSTGTTPLTFFHESCRISVTNSGVHKWPSSCNQFPQGNLLKVTRTTTYDEYCSEIRAYSYDQQVLASSFAIIGSQFNSFCTGVFSNVLTGYYLDSTCTVSSTNLSQQIKIQFSGVMYVNAVTLVGYSQSYSERSNILTVPSGTSFNGCGNSIWTKTTNEGEFSAQPTQQESIGICISRDQQTGVTNNQLGFRWIGIFATIQNCASTSNWTWSNSVWPSSVVRKLPPTIKEQIVSATLGDCSVVITNLTILYSVSATAVTHTNSVTVVTSCATSDGTRFPCYQKDFGTNRLKVRYNLLNGWLRIEVGPETPTGFYQVKLTASVKDGFTTNNSNDKLISFTVCAPELAMTLPVPEYYTVGDLLAVQFFLKENTCGYSDWTLNFAGETATTTPAWASIDGQTLTISGNVALISQSQHGQDLKVVLQAEDQNSAITPSYEFSITVKDPCSNGITMTTTVMTINASPNATPQSQTVSYSVQPSSTDGSTLTCAATLAWGENPQPTYFGLTMSGSSLILTPVLDQIRANLPVMTYSIPVTATSSSFYGKSINSDLQVRVTCAPTLIVNPTLASPFKFEVASGFEQEFIPLPFLTDCKQPASLSVQLSDETALASSLGLVLEQPTQSDPSTQQRLKVLRNSSSYAGQTLLKVTARATTINGELVVTQDFTVDRYWCVPEFQDSTLSISMSAGTAKELTWTMKQKHANCGGYQVTVSSIGDYLTTSLVGMTAAANGVLTGSLTLTADPIISGEYTLTITVTRIASEQSQSTSITLTITVTPCVVESLLMTLPETTYTYIVEVSSNPFDLITETTQTPSCGYSVTYKLVNNQDFLSIKTNGALEVNNSLITSANYDQTYTFWVKGQVKEVDLNEKQITMTITSPCDQADTTIPSPSSSFSVALSSDSSGEQYLFTLQAKQNNQVLDKCTIVKEEIAGSIPPELILSDKQVKVNVTYLMSELPVSLGVKTMTLKLVSKTPNGSSSTSRVVSFDLTVTCTSSSIGLTTNSPTLNSQESPYSYEVKNGLGSALIDLPIFETLPCKLAPTSYEVKLKSGETLAALPQSLVFNQNPNRLEVMLNDVTFDGSYDIRITASYYLILETQDFTVTRYRCDPQFETLPQPVTMVINTQQIVSWTMQERISVCGSYTTTVVSIAHESDNPTNPLTAVVPATGGVNLIATAETTLGVYTVKIKVTRSSDGAQSIDHDLSVTISSCLVEALSFTLTTTSVTHVVQVDPETHALVSSTSLTPSDCNTPVAFSLLPGSLSFLTINATGQLVFDDSQINSSDYWEHEVTVVGSADAVTSQIPITVTITSPCSEATISIIPEAITDPPSMEFDVHLTAQNDEPQSLFSLQAQKGDKVLSKCLITSQSVPGGLILLDGTVQADHQYLKEHLPSSLSSLPLTLQVVIQSPNQEESSNTHNFTINLTVTCEVSSIRDSSTELEDQNLELKASQLSVTFNMEGYEVQPCKTPFTLIVQPQGSTGTPPFVSITANTSFTIALTDLNWAGTYDLEVYALSEQIESTRQTFQLTLYDCTPEVTWTQDSDVDVSKPGPAVTYSWSIEFSTPATQDLCGDYSVTVSEYAGLTINPVDGADSFTIKADSSLYLGSPSSPEFTFTRDDEEYHSTLDACSITSFNPSDFPIVGYQADLEISISQVNTDTQTFDLSPSTILPEGTYCPYTAEIVLAGSTQNPEFVQVAEDKLSFTVLEAELPTDIPPIKDFSLELVLKLVDNIRPPWKIPFTVKATHPCVNTQIALQTLEKLRVSIHDMSIQTREFQQTSDTVSLERKLVDFCGVKHYSSTDKRVSITQSSSPADSWVLAYTPVAGQRAQTFKVPIKIGLATYSMVPEVETWLEVTLFDDCDSTVIDSRNQVIAPMSFTLKNSPTPPTMATFMPFTDSLAILYKNSTVCGPKQCSIVEKYPFVSLEAPLETAEPKKFTIKLSTTKPTDVGAYTATVKCMLTKFLTVKPATISFEIKIDKAETPPPTPPVQEPVSKPVQEMTANATTSDSNKDEPNQPAQPAPCDPSSQDCPPEDAEVDQAAETQSADQIPVEEPPIEGAVAETQTQTTGGEAEPVITTSQVVSTWKPPTEMKQTQIASALASLAPQSKKQSAKEIEKIKQVPMGVRVQQISSSGVITIAFTRPVELNPDFFAQPSKKDRILQASGEQQDEYVYGMLSSAFQVDFKSSSQAQLKDFKVVGFKNSQEISLQLVFDEPLYVSANADSTKTSQDQISVRLRSSKVFKDPTSETPIPADLLQETGIPVPKQLPSEQAAMMENVEKAAQSAISTGLPGMLAVNILIGVNLKAIWDAINIVGFMVQTQKWHMSQPANLEMFIANAAYFARGDFIPKERILAKLSLANEEDDEQAKQSKFFIAIGIIIGSLAALTGITILLLKKFESKPWAAYIITLLREIKDAIFWNTVIRTLIQCYMDFTITALLFFTMVNAATTTEKKPMDKKQALMLGSVITFFMLVIPSFFFYLIHTRFDHLEDKDKFNKYGVLWDGMKNKHYDAVLYNIVFMVRRFLFAIITVFVGSYDGSFALVLNVGLSIAYSMYLVHVKPKNSIRAHRLEVISETLMLYCFFGFMFCQAEANPKVKYSLGWWSVISVGLLVAMQYLNMIFEGIKEAIFKIKVYARKYLRRYGWCKKWTEQPITQTPEIEEEEYDSESDEEKSYSVEEEQPNLLVNKMFNSSQERFGEALRDYNKNSEHVYIKELNQLADEIDACAQKDKSVIDCEQYTVKGVEDFVIQRQTRFSIRPIQTETIEDDKLEDTQIDFENILENGLRVDEPRLNIDFDLKQPLSKDDKLQIKADRPELPEIREEESISLNDSDIKQALDIAKETQENAHNASYGDYSEELRVMIQSDHGYKP